MDIYLYYSLHYLIGPKLCLIFIQNNAKKKNPSQINTNITKYLYIFKIFKHFVVTYP